MKFIWFDDCCTDEEVEEMIKNKNKNCFESFSDMLYSAMKSFPRLSLRDLRIEPHYYDRDLDCQIYMVYTYYFKNTEMVCYFVQV